MSIDEIREKYLKEEGKLEGKLEGREEEKINTVIRLNSIGLSVEQIAQGVDLSVKDVEEILLKYRS